MLCTIIGNNTEKLKAEKRNNKTLGSKPGSQLQMLRCFSTAFLWKGNGTMWKKIICLLLMVFVLMSFDIDAKAANDEALSSQSCGTGWVRTAYPTTAKFFQVNGTPAVSYTYHRMTNIMADISNAKKGRNLFNNTMLRFLKNGEYEPAAYYIMMDYGYFTEYMDYFKQQGWIDPAYQLPKSYYKKLAATNDMYESYTGDCPIVDTFNAYRAESSWKSTKTGDAYVPKFILDGASVTQSANVDDASMEPLKNYSGNNSDFNAYYYYINYPDIRTAIGINGDALLNHWNTCGKAEGRVANVLLH